MSRRPLFPAVLAASLVSSAAAPPAWWAQRGATNAEPANDDAVVNLGQLKHFTRKAAEELNAAVPGGAGNDLNSLAQAWADGHPDPKDFDAVNAGQLKWIAGKVHGRLIHLRWEDARPAWLVQSPEDEQLANLGQLKTVFHFDLSAPSGQLPLWWRKFHFNGATGIDPNADADGDGLSNLVEFQNGTPPQGAETDLDADGVSNEDELAAGTSITDADTDNDGIPDGIDADPLDPDTIPLGTATALMVWAPAE